jgi:hypothetical protein
VLQARWASDRAAMSKLHDLAGAGDYSVYWVSETVPGPEGYYRFYEWAAMLRRVYGGQTRVGLDRRAYDASFLTQTQFFTDRYNLAQLDPHGCQADLTITPGPGAGAPLQTAATYTWDRLFDPGRLQAYLDGLVDVGVMPRPSADATGCTR